MKKILFAVGCLILLGIFGCTAFLFSTPKVETVAARPGEITRKVEEIGYVQSVDAQTLHAPVAGRISRVFVKEGDRVHIGQPLLTIDTPEWQEQLAALNTQIENIATQLNTEKINLELANSDLAEASRQVQLKESLKTGGIICQEEYNSASVARDRVVNSRKLRQKSITGLEEQRLALIAQRNHMQTRLQGLQIKSGLEGTVLTLPVKLNQVVTLGTVLTHVGPAGKLEVEIKLLANDLADVRLGQKAIVNEPAAKGAPITGTVTEIYPEARTVISSLGVEERRVPVIVSLIKPGYLKPGFEVRLSIITGHRKDALLIPREAIFSTPGGDLQVKKIVNNKVVVQTVKLGQKDSESVEIIEGLHANDLVVRDGSLELKQDRRVRF